MTRQDVDDFIRRARDVNRARDVAAVRPLIIKTLTETHGFSSDENTAVLFEEEIDALANAIADVIAEARR
jgi:hypothetical protein